MTRGRGGAHDERGAVAVMVALLLVPLMGFAAVVIDVSALYATRQQLQTGADAAALAIASDCLRGGCGSPGQTAAGFAAANLGTGTSVATVTSQTSSSVTVKNSATVQHIFAPALGIDSTPVSAGATATWGAPTSGTSSFPVLVNACEYNTATNAHLPTGTSVRTISWSPVSAACNSAGGIPIVPPTGRASYDSPGATWIKTSNGCQIFSQVGQELRNDGGNGGPHPSCSAAYFAALQNDVLLLPVFNTYRQQGASDNNVYFPVYGYVAFKLTGYYLDGPRWNSSCSTTCIQGYFTRLPDQDAAFTYGAAPQLGAGAVTLTR